MKKTINDTWEEVREAIRAICKGFPETYWQKLDQENDYPQDFVNELTQSGYLSALIPEEYGGAGLPIKAASVILEEIHRCGANGAACHAQMYIMGSLLKHGSYELKKVSSRDCKR